MLEQAVFNDENREVKKVELPEAIFGSPVRKGLLFDVVQSYLANRRQGTVKAKYRSEVRGSTRKIYRQKGTGRARHGGIRAGIFVGGGIAHPPRPRDWKVKIPQKMRRQALISALSLKKEEGNLLCVEAIQAKEPKTKIFAQQLKKWQVVSGLFVVERGPDGKRERNLVLASRNLSNVKVVAVKDLSAIDLMVYEKVIFTPEALTQLEKRL